jgi:hypothetical protein
MRRLLRPLWFALAALFLVEEWLWRRLSAGLTRIIAALGLRRLRQLVADAIGRLPPAAALVLFLLPALVLLPVKLLGLWMLAHGHWLGALAALVGAKLAGVGLAAFIFQATRPKLLRLGWFRWVHGKVQVALAWAHRKVDPWKERVRAWRRGLGGRLLRRLRLLRRRAQRA